MDNLSLMCMRHVLRLFDKKGMDPDVVATGLGDMVNLYEQMNEFGSAITVVLRMLKMAEMPQEILRECYTRHAELIRKEKGQGLSEEDKEVEVVAQIKLIEEKVKISSTPAAPQPRYDEDFYEMNSESITSKDRKPSSRH